MCVRVCMCVCVCTHAHTCTESCTVVSQTGKYSGYLVMTHPVSSSLLLSIAHHDFGGVGRGELPLSNSIYMILVEPLTMEPRVITTPPPPCSMLRRPRCCSSRVPRGWDLWLWTWGPDSPWVQRERLLLRPWIQLEPSSLFQGDQLELHVIELDETFCINVLCSFLSPLEIRTINPFWIRITGEVQLHLNIILNIRKFLQKCKFSC